MYKFFINSIKESRPLEIIYISKNGDISKRIIIVKKMSKSHLLAYCFSKNEYRTFYIDRILAALPYKKKYSPTA